MQQLGAWGGAERVETLLKQALDLVRVHGMKAQNGRHSCARPAPDYQERHIEQVSGVVRASQSMPRDPLAATRPL